MEEDNNDPSEINSICINKVFLTGVVYSNKKRKFQAEDLGSPLSKHKCFDHNGTLECDLPSGIMPEAEFYTCIVKGKIDEGAKDDESGPESAKGSNSFSADTDSFMSVSSETTDLQYPKTCPYDWPSTSSAHLGNSNCFKSTLYSLDSRALTKSSDSEEKSLYLDREKNNPVNDFGLHASLNFEEHLLEFGGHVDYGCSGDKDDIIEQCKDAELEDVLFSNDVNPNSFVLSSGRWNLNQGTQPGIKKLTIDKEFEQYFSMLML